MLTLKETSLLQCFDEVQKPQQIWIICCQRCRVSCAASRIGEKLSRSAVVRFPVFWWSVALPFEDLTGNWHWFMFPRSTEAVHIILTGFQVCSCGLPQDHWNEQFHHVTSLGRIWSSFQQGVGNEKPTTMIRWLGGLPLARAGANIACRLKHRISLSMVSRWPLNLKFWWEAWLFYFVWYSLESRDRRIMRPSTCLYIYLILDIHISYMYDYVWIYLCKDIVYIYISHLYR